MIEVHPNLYVGNESDFRRVQDGWSYLHAAREPFHRSMVGYSGGAAPKGDQYLGARRGNRMALNLLDAAKPEYIPDELLDAALAFMDERIAAGDKLLVHCNQGGSRGPSLALIWMHRKGELPVNPVAALRDFTAKYPAYKPGPGMTIKVNERLSKQAMDRMAEDSKRA